MHLFYRSKKRTRNIYSVVAKKVWCNDAIVLACSYFSGNDEQKTGTCSSAGPQPSSNIFSWFSTSASSIHPFSAPQTGKKVPFIGRRSEFLWNSFPPFFSREPSLQTSNSIPPPSLSLPRWQDGIAVQDTQLGGGEGRGEGGGISGGDGGRKNRGKVLLAPTLPDEAENPVSSSSPLLFFFFKGRVAIVQNRDQKASHFTATQTAFIPARIGQSAKAAFPPLSSRRSQCNERGREKCHCVSFSFLLSLCVSPCRVVDVDDDKAGGGKRENTRYMLSRRQGKEKKLEDGRSVCAVQGVGERECSTIHYPAFTYGT